MIEGLSLQVKVKGRPILKDVNFKIDDKVLVLGPNGSGKTTLLRVLSGLYKYEGSVKLNGVELRNISDFPSFSSNLPEVYHIAMKTEDLVSILSEIKECSEDIFSDMMNEAGVNPTGRNPSSLSLGERTVVFTALALCSKPEIIAIDEPFENLDKRRKGLMKRWLSEYGKEGFVVTHEMNVLKEFGSWKAFLMIEGRLYGPMVVGDFLRSKIVEGERDGSVVIEIAGKLYSLIVSNEGQEITDWNRLYDLV
ncbi:ATP-binding cassette domain-containing protein [Sulfuracidifex tepidarius]|uniref:Molybdate/tungstate import ATP-binding protein WtpC n=1 Tax=Sulfuracidifex tepidarius TaxID=1294262 RepID=A0A510E245_9CREN|nr:ABC transporter ATP-binding protein [Sulfuracidifex tepidarius]BBG26158.1 Molybdate/tungstate import ATP-binding protein WtpC [Sulfuracidifex tepidarius]